jgi:hypothetical protein
MLNMALKSDGTVNKKILQSPPAQYSKPTREGQITCTPPSRLMLQKTATPVGTGIKGRRQRQQVQELKQRLSTTATVMGRGIQRALTDEGNASRYRNSRQNGIGRGANIVDILSLHAQELIDMLPLEAQELLDMLSLQAWELVLEPSQIHTVTRAGSCTGICMAVCENLSRNLEFHPCMRISSSNFVCYFILVGEFHPRVRPAISSSN